MDNMKSTKTINVISILVILIAAVCCIVPYEGVSK